tara:strand:+ start:1131 stop:1829 length:699 start_codon:yes stop_codon:yes gene_type:complete
MTYVYLKTQAFSGSNLAINTIPLQITSVALSVTKTIPSFPIPLSGVISGESITAALDLGMATKNISLTGVINDTLITKTIGGVITTRTFTAHEVAQMIAAGVDSTGFAKNQAFSELVVLMPSFVRSDYNYSGTCNVSGNNNKTDCLAAGGTWTEISTLDDRNTGSLVPLTFGSRGGSNAKDNKGVPSPFSLFPDSSTDTGLTGFVRTFGCNFEAEAHDISFNLDFEIASVIP